MPKIWKNYRLWAVLLTVVALSFTMSFTSKNRERLSVLESGAIAVTAPFQSALSDSLAWVRGTFASVNEWFALKKENAELKKEVARLRGVETRLAAVEAELEEMTRQAGFYNQHRDLTLIPARVVGRNPDNWFSTVLINVGSADGVRVDMPVIVGGEQEPDKVFPSGLLVGRVFSVDAHWSKVMLITDPRCGVGAQIARTREMGIVEGRADNPDLLQMTYLSRDATISLQDEVITSNRGGTFPEGLLIGKIKAVHNDELGLFKKADIVPAVDFDKLHLVYVLAQNGEAVSP